MAHFMSDVFFVFTIEYLIITLIASRVLTSEFRSYYGQHNDKDIYERCTGSEVFLSRFNTYNCSDVVSDERCKKDEPLSRIPVETNYGVVIGKKIHLCDGPSVPKKSRPPNSIIHRSLNVFLGIPYAQPPTRENNLQFKPPEEPAKWGEDKLAFTFKPACLQHEKYIGRQMGVREMSEDCLYLNIFAPCCNKDYPEGSYAVMIYIHGDNWDHGSSSTFPGQMLAASQDVIVVTFNYRLGHLGFLATGDGVSNGNYGMLDQVMAVRWVYNNIEYFKGDRNRITLFGVGSGAASAGLLAISPLTKHIVKRVIAQSGSAIADWAAVNDTMFMYNNSRLAGEFMGCPMTESAKLVECLSKRTISDFKTLELKPRIGWLPWAPVVDIGRPRDKIFLPNLPEDTLENQDVIFDKEFAYMSGVTKDEASIFLKDDPDLQRFHYQMNEKLFQFKLTEFMRRYNYTINFKAIFDALSFMYSPWQDPSNMTLILQGYIHMLSDRYYKAPNDKMVKLMLKNNVKTYMYVLNYTCHGVRTRSWEGVPHNMEYFLITGAPFLDSKFYPPHLNLHNDAWSELDREMSEFFMTAWANFAKEGKPTPKQVFNTILWEPMSFNDLQYLAINATNITGVMERNYRQKESKFWKSYFPSLIDREPPTLAPTLEPWIQQERIYRGALWGSVSAGILFLVLSLVFCCLYCRIRRYDTY